METKAVKRKGLYGKVSDMDIHLLRVFRTVVECGGFSAAEVELNVGRSAISRYMKDLEIRLDLRLCMRGRSGFTLTDHGRVVYDATRQLFLDLERFRTAVNAAHSRLVGTLTLSLTDDIITDTNARTSVALARFHEIAPDVRIDLNVGSPNEVERAVIEGRALVGVVPFHHQLPAVQYFHLYDETQFLYCGAGHDIFHVADADLSVDLIRDQDFVVPGYTLNAKFQALFPDKSPAARTNKIEGVTTLILSGKYIGFVPEQFAQRWVGENRLRSLLPRSLFFHSPFVAITHKDAQPNLLRDAFLAELRTAHSRTYREKKGSGLE
ncbi:MAG TPA: LysR family transcriptional regulator [Aromatoleum sp.]|uniref:LysR family transcriptional regulator n=1 Tax=Aromatoleum sp. TaxID=2307007 RepID=UPI002B484C43|nr:LysR family transcriptional regulator [Aromatoleum sp.]HJV24613.1 LysR family transcriptional regulator [Aromatoleum sp.]